MFKFIAALVVLGTVLMIVGLTQPNPLPWVLAGTLVLALGMVINLIFLFWLRRKLLKLQKLVSEGEERLTRILETAQERVDQLSKSHQSEGQ